MAHARSRHYRVAQKAAEAQICQEADECRRDHLVFGLTVFVLVMQIINLAFTLCGLFGCNDPEEY